MAYLNQISTRFTVARENTRAPFLCALPRPEKRDANTRSSPLARWHDGGPVTSMEKFKPKGVSS